MTIDPIKVAIAPYMLAIKVAIALILLLAVFVGGCSHGAGKWKGKYQDEARLRVEENINHTALLNALDRRAKAAQAAADAASSALLADRKSADERFTQAKKDSDHEIAGLRRALRAGTLQLRPEFACAAPRPAEGAPAAVAGTHDADPGVREAREGAILSSIDDADRADRWIVWLQTELTSTRKACGVN